MEFPTVQVCHHSLRSMYTKRQLLNKEPTVQVALRFALGKLASKLIVVLSPCPQKIKMLTDNKLKSQIDALWNRFWSGVSPVRFSGLAMLPLLALALLMVSYIYYFKMTNVSVNKTVPLIEYHLLFNSLKYTI